MSMTYAQMNDMADIASKQARAADAGVAVTVVNDVNHQAFAIWTLRNGKMNSHLLDAANSSQERLNLHVEGFVANTVQAA